MKLCYYKIFLGLVFCLVFFSGCKTPGEYKKLSDEEVYQIIDEKWDPNYGSLANYRVSDVNKAAISIDRIDPNEVKGKLSLSDSLLIATVNSRDYQNRKEDLYLTALDLTLERHNFARRWFGTVDTRYTRDESDETVTGNSSRGGFGFSRLLSTGGLITLDLANNWTSFLTGSSRTTIDSILSSSFSQPLLRGAWEEVAQEPLKQAERNALYEIRSFNRFRKEFVVSIVSEYFTVLQRKDSVVNAENNLERRIDSLQRLELEAEVGRKPYFEVDQAQQDVLTAEDNYVSAVQRYEQSLDNFKLRLALPTDANVVLDQEELAILKEKGIEEPAFSVEDATDTGLVMRLDLANEADFVDDAKRKVFVAENNLKGDLGISASTNVQSTPRTRPARLRFNDGFYTIGLDSDLPLDRKLEANAYRESLLTVNRAIRNYNERYDLVKLEIRDAYRNLQEAAQRYKIQKNSLELAKKRVESTSFLLEAGRAQTRDLLESQDALLQAENNVSAALVDHLIAKLNFFKDVGVLQVKPDGSWLMPNEVLASNRKEKCEKDM